MSASLLIYILFFSFFYITNIKAAPFALNEGRIVGGWETLIAYFPYQVSLQLLGRHTCGGILIADNLVLTAAHCVTFYDSQFYNIRAGSSLKDQEGIIAGVKTIIAHELHDEPSYANNDIAVLILENPLPLNEYIQPLKWLNVNQTIEDMTILYVSGWGFMHMQFSEMSLILRYTEVQKLPLEMCKQAYEQIVEITENMLCAGWPDGGSDSCQGDSGGPLVAVIDDEMILVGIVSFGLGCGLAEYPGVYTKVQNYDEWLREIMGEVISNGEK